MNDFNKIKNTIKASIVGLNFSPISTKQRGFVFSAFKIKNRALRIAAASDFFERDISSFSEINQHDFAFLAAFKKAFPNEFDNWLNEWRAYDN